MKTLLISALLFFLNFTNIFAGGVVYLVLGSDTAIWNGMNTGKHDNYYNIDLYVNPDRNAYKVMDPSFRAQLMDSYGTPLKMTWWMMAGNIFRYATNTNIPTPNTMTLYLMKKYHGDNVAINGDELSLHYHTFFWSDYDGDGVYYWNQAKTFLESKDDFNFTLAQFLLEEEVFPVSFRSGWHYMDNDWQHYLDQRILPYSLHNDYPAKRTYDDEPIDNIFDWSEAPAAWVPYNPSYTNYQIPGNGKGWQVRSAHFWKTRVNDYLDTMFSAANNGTNQIACIWGHLPENNFLENIEKIDSIAHAMEERYPDVTFRYCTAVEAMQRWRKANDFQAPQLTITEIPNGNKISFTITSDETIFQTQPFVALKDINNNYRVINTIRINNNEWKTSESFDKNELVRVGVTVCDTLGNQSMKFIDYLPADTFIDNKDSNYSELSGSWITSSSNSWGTDSRIITLTDSNYVSAKWNHTIIKSHYYNFFVQIPEFDNTADNFSYIFYKNSTPIDTIQFYSTLTPMKWNYLATKYFNKSDIITVELIANGTGQSGRTICADVLKISAMVKEKEITTDSKLIEFEDIVYNDTINYPLTISNLGITELKIFGLKTNINSLINNFSYPIIVPAMSSIDINLQFLFSEIGLVSDTLLILSDDPFNSKLKIPITANVQDYFVILDNEDSLNYTEYGEWHTSVATSHGESSRYAWLNSNPLPSAIFKTQLNETGLYDIAFIVPQTINSTDKALYEIKAGNVVLDSVFIDQNKGSGAWVLIGKYFLPMNIDINIKIIDTGESTTGSVLRADAIKFQLIERLSNTKEDDNRVPMTFELSQNYPNPFNPSTKIRYSIPIGNNSMYSVQLKVYDILGKEVATLVNKEQSAGYYEVEFNSSSTSGGKELASGIYLYRIQIFSSGHKTNYIETKKMLLLR